MAKRSLKHRFAPRNKRSSILTTSVAALLATSLRLHAQLTWNGGSAVDSNWSQQDVAGVYSNWSGATSFPSGSDLIFAGTTRLNPNNDFTGYIANTITFNATAGAFMLTGNALQLTAGIANNSSNTQTISFGGAGITLGGNQTWNAGGAALLVTSNIALGGFTLTITGMGADTSGQLKSDVSTEIDGVISGAGGITVNTGVTTDVGPGGSVYLANNSNSYTGPTNVLSGILWVAANGALSGSGVTVSSGATLGINGGVTVGALPLTISGAGVGGGVGPQPVGALFGGAYGLGNSEYDGAITLAGDATIGTYSGSTFTLAGGIDTQGHQLTLGTETYGSGNTGNIDVTTAPISGSGSVVVDSQSATFAAANTYTGMTALINGATLNANVAGALPAPVADGGMGTVRSAVLMDQTGTGGSTLSLGASQAIASLTGAVSSKVNLNANTLTIGAANSATTTEFDGVISDGGLHGSLVKDGASTQILGGINTYSGATTVSGGTLQVGNGTTGNLTGTSGVTVANSATLATNLADGATFSPGVNLNGATAALNAIQAGTNTLSGVISGSGILNQNGAGTTILTNTNTYSGNTTVNAGTLEVDGSIASASTLVNAAGTLQGLGTIGGSMTNSGTVNPGNASGPGVLKVSGNYTQSSSGNLVIGLASTSTYGRLQIGGTANLNGTVTAVALNGYQPQLGNSFQIVTAAGGLNGTRFSGFNNLLPSTGTLLLPVLNYSSTAVTLTITQGPIPIGPNNPTLPGTGSGTGNNFVFSTSGPDAITPNEIAVAKVINSVLNDPRMARILAYLDSQPLGAIPGLLDRIAPEEQSSTTKVTVALSGVQAQNIQNRTAGLRSGIGGFSAQGFHLGGDGPDAGDGADGLAGPNGPGGNAIGTPGSSDPRVAFFITGAGEWAGVSDTAIAHGYNLATGGFTLGVDYKFTPNFIAGIDGGYARTGVDLENGGRNTVDAGKLGLYGTYFTGGFYIDAAVGGGYDGYDSNRSGLQGDALGSTNGGELNVLFGTGYDWHVGGLSVGPMANFQYSYIGMEGFTEHGSLAPLSYPEQSVDSIRSAVGMKASYDWKMGGVLIKPEVRASWQHEFGDTVTAGVVAGFANGAGNDFTVYGPEIGRDSLLVGVGFSVLWNDRTSSYVYYDGELGRTNYQSSTISGGIRIAF